MKVNYAGEKRRRELALKQKKEEKAKKLADRKATKAQQGDEPDADLSQDDQDVDTDTDADVNEPV